MQLRVPTLEKISEMICGDNFFTFFPYRSSPYLTKFFVELDLDYIHDGSTRRVWVREVLEKLNKKPSVVPSMPSPEITKVLESLLHPDYFLFNDNWNHGRAIETVSASLKSSGLIIKAQANGTVRVLSINNEFVSNSFDESQIEQLITIKPSVFQVPADKLNQSLIAVMMPFSGEFKDVYSAIRKVADSMDLECLRADDIWNNSTFIQDIFDIIFRANVVIVDFTGRNPNVFYETGIAHALGKIVIPITQSIDDIPSDLRHHRALKYLLNKEGLEKFSSDLYDRLKMLYK